MKKWFQYVAVFCAVLLASGNLAWASPAQGETQTGQAATEAAGETAAGEGGASGTEAAEIPGLTDAERYALHTVAGEKAEVPSVESPTAILVDRKSGAILYQKEADTTFYPASITKIMTALLTLENCSLDEMVTFSYRATHELEEGATHIARTEGEEMTVRDCLYALLLQSANEVAQALAEHISGSIEDFGVLMTERAKELGCTHTNFVNPSGLNNENHYTTVHDMAIIMRAALDTPGFLEIDSTLTYEIPPTNKHEESTWVAHKHPLLKYGDTPYEYAVAGKTGYTQLAGNSLVTYAVKGDAELICVIMNAPAGCRAEDTIALLEYGFNNFTWHSMAESAQGFLDGQPEAAGLENAGPYRWGEDAWIVLPNSADVSALTAEAGPAEIQGDVLSGSVTYQYQGEEAGVVHYARTQIQPAAETGAPEESTAEAAVAPEEEGGFSWKTFFKWAAIVLGVLALLFGVFFVVYNWQQLKRRRRYRNRYRMRKMRRRRRRRW